VEGCGIRDELILNFAFGATGRVQYLFFPATLGQTLMEAGFLDRLANQLKANKGAYLPPCHPKDFWCVSRNTTRVAKIRAPRMPKMSFEDSLRAI